MIIIRVYKWLYDKKEINNGQNLFNITFYMIQEKSDPHSPISMLIRVMLSEASARSPTLADGGGEGLW